MKTKITDNIKLGIFVLTALTLLILILYMIGKNSNMFGDNYILKARFENLQGLKAGNNIRFSGINVGTVKSVYIINDTTLEIKMIIEKKAKDFIKKNSIVSIGTDGLVGNKVVNINAVKEPAPNAEQNDILPTRKPVDTDEMMRTLSKTNNKIANIAEDFGITINKLNNSKGIWQLLNDSSIAVNINQATQSINHSSKNIIAITEKLNRITDKINNGNGTISTLINDSNITDSLITAINNISKAGNEITSASIEIKRVASTITSEINNGHGTVHLIMKDSGFSNLTNTTMKNIENGTRGFSENMEALKHNFLFRGYFKKLRNKH